MVNVRSVQRNKWSAKKMNGLKENILDVPGNGLLSVFQVSAC